MDKGKVSQAGESLEKGSWDRRCRHGKDFNRFPEFFKFFLVPDPETVFLVDNGETKIVKIHVVREKAVSANNDIKGSVF